MAVGYPANFASSTNDFTPYNSIPMNTFLPTPQTIASLFLLAGLASCQPKENLISPEQQRALPVESVNDLILPGLPKKYTLVKHGQATLTYSSDGRIKKVTYGAGAISYPADYVNYLYGANSIKATSYSGNTVVHDELYLTDGNGRCYESKETNFTFYSFGTVASEMSWSYQYNALGQVKSRTPKASGTGKTDYTFSAAGDLIKVTTFGNLGVTTKETTIAYDQPVGDPVVVDRYPLNAGWTGLPDVYLKIFGKPSKHLVKLVTQKLLPSNLILANYYYAYTLNADGYVTKQNMFNVANAALVSTTPYEYLVTDMVVQ